MRSTIARVLVLVVSIMAVLLYLPAPAATQSPVEFSDEARERARGMLDSDYAEFLSSSALFALRRISGQALTHGPLVKGMHLHGESIQLAPSVVMVNDPTQDTFTASDITTQSETATAGFGNTILVAFNDDGQFFTDFPANFRTITGYSRSNDDGATFVDMGLIPVSSTTGFTSGDPGLVADRSGSFYASSIAFEGARPAGFENVVAVQKSLDDGITWGPPVYPPAAGVSPGSFQDKDFIAVDATGGPYNGNVYLSWTSVPSSGPMVVFFSRSTDGGATFSTPFSISAAGPVVQGSEPVVGPGGEVYVTWLELAATTLGEAIKDRILIAKSSNGGASFGAPVQVAPLSRIGFGTGLTRILAGNFRVNSYPRIDVNPLNGEVYIVYAAKPIGPDGADVFFVRSSNGGASWSSPIRVNDDTGTNDQWFPDIAVNGQGAIEAFWYDRRADPQNVGISVYRARSFNGGVSFEHNHKVTHGTSLPAVGFDTIINRLYMGDYIDIKAKTISTGKGRALDFLLAWGDFRRTITTLGGTRPDQDVFFTIH